MPQNFVDLHIYITQNKKPFHLGLWGNDAAFCGEKCSNGAFANVNCVVPHIDTWKGTINIEEACKTCYGLTLCSIALDT